MKKTFYAISDGEECVIDGVNVFDPKVSVDLNKTCIIEDPSRSFHFIRADIFRIQGKTSMFHVAYAEFLFGRWAIYMIHHDIKKSVL
jgi:hypothetical protein